MTLKIKMTATKWMPSVTDPGLFCGAAAVRVIRQLIHGDKERSGKQCDAQQISKRWVLLGGHDGEFTAGLNT